ncbi:MAG TPA: RagB/SusD family nutrient uptake outer membrane protein [Bacteroidales bacterium]|nr:RagB/SusD family nutrient uptake outer membrane protein [Bacteroidales bacterium]
MKKIIYSIFFVMTVSFIFSACSEDWLEVLPTDGVSDAGVTASTRTAMASLNGIHRALYVRYGSQGRCGLGAWFLHIDEQGEDMVFNYATWTTHLRWLHRSATSSYNERNWLMFYGWIANANVLINGIDENTTGSQDEKDYIIGQALLYRAYCHYQLVQQYGNRYVPGGGNTQLGVPYMTEATTEGQPRNTVEEVYQYINQDIDDAIIILEGKSRMNKSHLNVDVARGLKARVALTMGNYATAVTYAQQARVGYELMDSATYHLGFYTGSQGSGEYMWATQIQEDQTDKWGNYGAYVSRNFSSTSIRRNPRSINNLLYDQIADTDVRKILWDPTGDHLDLEARGIEIVASAKRYPYTNQKFIAVSTSDSRVDVPNMRVSEMYLIEAEAQARRQGNDPEAAAALYTMAVARDPSYILSINTGQDLIDEIMIQRRVELWGEGQRFFDLKRLNLDLDRTGSNHRESVNGGLMQVPAGDTRWTSLIPQDEMDANPLMVQNDL